jgi:hypothetical protein
VDNPPELVEGRDGLLYAVTSSIVFRINKSGGGYRALHTFADAGDAPGIGLVQGRDGAFYGTTYLGGVGGYGSVFKLWPPETPEMIGVAPTNGGATVSFAGETGARYQVLRSKDLTQWSVLDTITMSTTGIIHSPDNSPPGPTVSYRAAWVP